MKVPHWLEQVIELIRRGVIQAKAEPKEERQQHRPASDQSTLDHAPFDTTIALRATPIMMNCAAFTSPVLDAIRGAMLQPSAVTMPRTAPSLARAQVLPRGRV